MTSKVSMIVLKKKIQCIKYLVLCNIFKLYIMLLQD